MVQNSFLAAEFMRHTLIPIIKTGREWTFLIPTFMVADEIWEPKNDGGPRNFYCLVSLYRVVKKKYSIKVGMRNVHSLPVLIMGISV